MTENQYDKCEEANQTFLNKVRAAYREMKSQLTDEELDYIIYKSQDALSLFSPWMNGE